MADYTSNQYMSSPNADIYAMLARQNEAERERASRYVGGGGGGVAEVNMGDIMEQLANSQDASLRDSAMQSLNRSLDMRQGMSMQQKFMEDVARQKMDLMLQSQALNLEMAGMEAESKIPAMEKLMALQQKLADINGREIAAHAELGKRNPEFAKEYAGRLNEVKTLADAQTTFRQGVEKGFNAEEAIKEFMANPNKGGQMPSSALAGLGKGILRGGEFISELVSGDRTADTDIASYLSGLQQFDPTDASKIMVDPTHSKTGLAAAAARFRGLKEAAASSSRADFFNTGPGALMGRLADTTYQAEADRFNNQFLSDLVVKGLANSGMTLDMGVANQAVKSLLGAINDVSRSSSLSPQEASDRINKAMQQASFSLFGTSEGTKGIPKLAEALDVMLSRASSQAGNFAQNILGADRTFNVSSIQNAAAAYALESAGRYHHVLKAGLSGRVNTAEQLNMALGRLKGAYNPQTGALEVGLLDLSPTTEAGRETRVALGDKTARSAEDLLGLIRKTEESQAALSKEKTGVQMSDMLALLQEEAAAPARVAAAKRSRIEQMLAGLRARPR